MEKIETYKTMGYNKKFLPDLESLQDLYKKVGHSEFVSSFIKYNVYIGSPQSIEYVEKKINTYYKQFKKPN